jgi:AsmA protein
MKALFKWLAIGLGSLVLLLVIAVIALPMFFDPNDFRDELVDGVKSNTGRDLTIDGDIGLSVFPWLGVELGAMKLGNAPGFKEPVFASTQRVSVRIKLMPLLSRRIEADKVVVDGLILNLARNKSGKTNWADMAQKGDAASADEPGKKPAAAAGEGESGSALAGLAIGGLAIQGAKITWRDAASGQDFTVDNVRLDTGLLEPNKPVDVAFGLDLAAAAAGLAGKLTANTTLTLDLKGPRISLTPLKVEAELEGKAVPGSKAEIGLESSSLIFDGKAQEVTVSDLQLSVFELVAKGQLNVSALDKTPKVTGNIAVAEFSPRKLLAGLGIAAPVTADTAVLEKASFSAALVASPTSAALSKLNLKLDDSTILGDLSVPAFAGPKIRFSVALDSIDADRYLPPVEPAGSAKQEGASASAKSPSGTAAKTPAPDFTALRQLDAAGDLKIGKLKISNLNTSDILVKLSAANGLVRLSPITASLYKGKYNGDLTFDARKDVPLIKVADELAGVQAEPLLKDLNGEDRLSGTANLKVAVTTKGIDPQAIKSALNGKVNFSFTNGALKGVNVARLIREGKAKLKGQTLPPAKEELKTDFSEMTGSIDFKNGLGNNRDFLAKSPLLRITGAGTANLVTEALDYKVKTAVVKTSKGQGGKDLQDLAGVEIPLQVTGTFGDPKYALDVAALGKALAGSKVKDLVSGKKEEAVESIKKKLGGSGSGDSVNKLLKGVLGN